MSWQRVEERLVNVGPVSTAAFARGEMTRRGVLSIVTAACLAVLGPVAVAARAATANRPLVDLEVLERGAAWLQARQASDGGYPNPRGEVAFGATADAVCALVALRNAGIEVETDRAVAYLRANAADEAESLAGGVGRAVVALVAAGVDPRDVGGADLVARIGERWDAGSASYGEDLISTIYALLALAAAGEDVPGEAIGALAAIQLEDGAWSYAGTADPGSGDAVTTAFVVQALAAGGRGTGDPAVSGAIDYLRTVQVEGGAFAYGPGFPGDANTTALVLSALTAAGEDLEGGAWGGAVAALGGFQNGSGAFRYTDQEPGDDIQVTTVALLALAGERLPVVPVG